MVHPGRFGHGRSGQVARPSDFEHVRSQLAPWQTTESYCGDLLQIAGVQLGPDARRDLAAAVSSSIQDLGASLLEILIGPAASVQFRQLASLRSDEARASSDQALWEAFAYFGRFGVAAQHETMRIVRSQGFVERFVGYARGLSKPE